MTLFFAMYFVNDTCGKFVQISFSCQNYISLNGCGFNLTDT